MQSHSKTLCDLVECSPPGSSIHGILQARLLEWVDISFSKRSCWSGVEPVSPAWAAGFFTTSASWKVLIWVDKHIDIDPFRKLSATRNLSFSHLSSSISCLGNSICYASGSFCFNTPITFLLHIYICFNFPSCFCYFRTPGIVRRVGVR